MPLDQLHEVEREQERGEMTFFEHIAELRTVLVRSAMAIGAVMAFFMFNKDFVFLKLLYGPRNPDFPTYRALCWLSKSFGAGETMCLVPEKYDLQAIELGEVLMQHLYLSFWLGFIAACPFVFWQFWKFVSPGLHDNEKSAIRGVVAICSLLFFLGVAFGYYIVAPLSMNFLAGYTVEQTTFAPKLDSYVTYMTMFTIPIGLIFEMPMVGYFLAKIGIVGKKSMKMYRRHAIVAIFIVAAIITPPDVVSQTLVSIPLLLLYEATIIVVGRVEAERLKKLANDEISLPQKIQ